MSELALRGVSALGFVAMLGIAWLCAEERRRPSWRLLGWGMGSQLLLGVLLLETAVGSAFFGVMDAVVGTLEACTDAGVRFVFGSLAPPIASAAADAAGTSFGAFHMNLFFYDRS